MRRLSLLLCLLSLSCFAMQVGVNLNGIFDSDPALMYADAMMSARNWGTTGNCADEAATVDANGWPTGDACVWLFSVTNSAYPSMYGTYAMSWDSTGTPTIAIAPDAVNWTISGKSCAGGHCTATLTAASGALGEINLTFTGTSGGVRNLKVMRPIAAGSATSHSTSEKFSRQWLAALAPWDVFRTMDLTITNNSNVTTWSQRTSATWATHKGPKLSGLETGAPWEDVCAIANAFSPPKDLWINVPAQADDNYVTQLATLLKSTCPASSKIYVEYGNENWNNQFTQPQVVYDRGACENALAWQATHAYTTASQVSTVSATQGMYAINDTGKCYKATTGGTSAGSGGPTGTGSAITDGTVTWAYIFSPADNPSGGGTVLTAYDGDTNAFDMEFRYTALRTKQISSLFSAVYGSSAMGNQVRVVLEGHGAGAPLLNGLEFLQGQFGAPSQWLWGAGAAQYFAESGSTSNDAAATATRIIEEYKAALPQLAADQATISTVAHNYGLHVAMYEGGPASAGATSLTAKTSANTDTRIEQIIWDWLSMQRDSGADLVMQYQFISAWGSTGLWGLTNDVYNLNQPKYIALSQWKLREKQRPRLPLLTINGKAYNWLDGVTFNSGNGVVCNGVNTKIRWKFAAPGTGSYKVAVTYNNNSSATTATVNVDGTTVFTGTLPDHSGSNVSLPVNNYTGVVSLTKGDNTVEWWCTSSPNQQVTIQSVAISDQ